MFENIKEYKGLKVVRESMWSWKYNSARYKSSVITLYDYFYTFTHNKQKAVLEHEFAHHIFNTLPRKVKIFWVIQSKSNRVYINSHAKKNFFEDFGECIEAYNLIKTGDLPKQTGMLNLKIQIAVSIYKYYMYDEIAKLLVNKYNQKSIDFDGLWGHQCVDLVQQYIKEFLLQKNRSFGGSAKNGWGNKWNTFPKDKWEKIEYTGKNKPKVGDIVFYDNEPYGHTGVCVWDDWVIFEQNTGNWDGQWTDDYCTIELMPKKDLVGWYRLKKD